MRARHAALVEHSADAIVAVDIDGRITALNPAAGALYGFPEREALGQSPPTCAATTERRHGAAQVLAGEVVAAR